MTERQAVRALILSPQDELLLIKIIEPQSKHTFWLTPGGGIDPGESPLAGLRREIFEETGLADFEIGPEIWRRQCHFVWNSQTIQQNERYYLIRVPRFEPTARHVPNEVEHAAFDGFRWWTASEIEQSQDAFAPRGLSRLFQSLIKNGPSTEPIVLTQ